MIENIDASMLVNWSRLQFALTAIYHWFFVPLTLGITFIIAIMESIYVKTGDEKWKKITKFWMTIFGINFAIGVATGIILEFEFGTNWSNYSWFVGDIFGAPLAIEGIMAFFMESTFIALMFFGWNKLSKKAHLTATWMTAIGANLSALWILVANGWMQDPRGMQFNPDTARNEMVNFWDVFLSPTAVNKFLHTISSSYVLAAIVVIGISSWYLLKKRNIEFAKKSILVASVFGLITAIFTVLTGDGSSRQMAKVQPMKFAAMEGLYEGMTNAPLVAVGLFERSKPDAVRFDEREFLIKFEIPDMLSLMAFLDPNAYVAGIRDFLHGHPERGIMAYTERMERGKVAINTLAAYKTAVKDNNTMAADSIKALFNDPQWKNDYFQHFGYGYYDDVNAFVPSVPITFYSFHIMVILGIHFFIFFIVFYVKTIKNTLNRKKWILYVGMWTVPLAYLASQMGWLVAEMGRQPWVIQDLLPTVAAVSRLSPGSVQLTFWLFLVLFTGLLIAELKIMFSTIKKGPQAL